MIKIELAEIQEKKTKKGTPFWQIKDTEARVFSTFNKDYMEKIKADKGGEIEFEEKKVGDYSYNSITEVKGVEKPVQKSFGGGRGNFRTPEQIKESEKLTRQSIEKMACLKSAVEYAKILMGVSPNRKEPPDWKVLASDMLEWIKVKEEKKNEKV